MPIKVEQVKKHYDDYRIQLFDNSYGNSLSKFKALSDLARADFPRLTDDDIQIIEFGGTTKKGIWGIEFSRKDKDHIPDAYIDCPLDKDIFYKS